MADLDKLMGQARDWNSRRGQLSGSLASLRKYDAEGAQLLRKLTAALDAHEPPFTHEFFVVMQKRRTGPIYPDLHKTNERIYFTEEDANRALDADPELKPYRHVVRMAAFVAAKENNDD